MANDDRETEEYVERLIHDWEDRAELAALELARIEREYVHISILE
jgi:hypothetical protein